MYSHVEIVGLCLCVSLIHVLWNYNRIDTMPKVQVRFSFSNIPYSRNMQNPDLKWTQTFGYKGCLSGSRFSRNPDNAQYEWQVMPLTNDNNWRFTLVWTCGGPRLDQFSSPLNPQIKPNPNPGFDLVLLLGKCIIRSASYKRSNYMFIMLNSYLFTYVSI